MQPNKMNKVKSVFQKKSPPRPKQPTLELIEARHDSAVPGARPFDSTRRRAVLVVFLALLTFNVSGLAALCDDAPCDESCPTDASGGQCPPNCHFCSCCSLPKVTGSGGVAVLIPPEQDTVWLRSSDRPSSPEPADILHVPKLLLA